MPLTLIICTAYARQCAWYVGLWSDGVLLWEHAVNVQQGRPEWLRGGPTTHALAEYGMQLSWAGRHAEAARVLERQIRLAEAGASSNTWPLMGRLNPTGYAPLSIVKRILGDHRGAVAVADRGLEIIHRSGAGADGTEQSREVARIVAARSLALFAMDPQAAVAQMQAALQMSAHRDAVVLSLAKQLNDHIEAVMGAAR